MSHQIQLTSLWCRWPEYGQEQFNERFRQRIESEILNIHQYFPDGLTDDELGEILRIKLGEETLDTDVYRPRRCDLSSERRGKRGNLLRPSFLFDSGKKRPNIHGRPCIVWKLDPINLTEYMEN